MMVVTTLLLSGAVTALPQSFVCERPPTATELALAQLPGSGGPPQHGAIEITFIEVGTRISNVRIVNPPLFAGGTATDWRGKRTRHGFKFWSTDDRKENVEPGRIELRGDRGEQGKYSIHWEAYITGGHVPFVDVGDGECRHTNALSAERGQ